MNVHKTISFSRVLTIIIVLFAISMASESDTTYGKTRLVPKSSTTADSPQESSNSTKDMMTEYKGEDEDCTIFGCIAGEILWGIFRFAIVEPFKAMLIPPEHFEGMSGRRVKITAGGSFLDFTYLYHVAFNSSLRFDAGVIAPLRPGIYFRQRIGLQSSSNGSLFANYQREVYENGNSIGTVLDVGRSYSRRSLQIFSEVLVHPDPQSASGYFFVGLGPSAVTERSDLSRTYDYRSGEDRINDRDNDILPAFSAGVGRLIPLRSIHASFEMRYSLTLNRNRRTHSLPGDNVPFTHGVTLLHYQWLF